MLMRFICDISHNNVLVSSAFRIQSEMLHIIGSTATGSDAVTAFALLPDIGQRVVVVK